MPALSLCAAHGRDTLYGAPRPGGMLPRRAKGSRTHPVCYAKSEVLSLKARPASPRAPKTKLLKLSLVCCANAGNAFLAEEALVFAKRRGLAAAVQGAYSGLRLGLPRVVRKAWRGILEL
ncbi:hypothetical protein H70357_03335 [Paenibacillus sp. FSL H7-0357]|uniref:hypothetical protein n=1 Tax=Paenibacillus sp. sgz500992 TaxID=3242476 RepID=UPI0004F74536|nr:hypothetical protein H70357_03335 [Paenibacillus sp. FSL H7-0357]